MPPRLPNVTGHAAVLAGSCSRATLTQLGIARIACAGVATRSAGHAGCRDSLRRRRLTGRADKLGDTADRHRRVGARRTGLPRCRQKLGRDAAGALIEAALAQIAEGIVAHGARRIVVAGGETAGAVVQRLGVSSLRIGAEIDPGVPWTYAQGSGAPLLMALKSGNFGAPDFFLKAFEMLEA